MESNLRGGIREKGGDDFERGWAGAGKGKPGVKQYMYGQGEEVPKFQEVERSPGRSNGLGFGL